MVIVAPHDYQPIEATAAYGPLYSHTAWFYYLGNEVGTATRILSYNWAVRHLAPL